MRVEAGAAAGSDWTADKDCRARWPAWARAWVCVVVGVVVYGDGVWGLASDGVEAARLCAVARGWVWLGGCDGSCEDELE